MKKKSWRWLKSSKCQIGAKIGPPYLIGLHGLIFEGVFPHAGSIREANLRKREWVLMAVNVELLMTCWEIGAFLSSEAFSTLNDRHQKQLTAGLDFFPVANWKKWCCGR